MIGHKKNKNDTPKIISIDKMSMPSKINFEQLSQAKKFFQAHATAKNDDAVAIINGVKYIRRNSQWVEAE